VQDYKSLCAAVTICSTQTHRQHLTSLYEKLSQLARAAAIELVNPHTQTHAHLVDSILLGLPVTIASLGLSHVVLRNYFRFLIHLRFRLGTGLESRYAHYNSRMRRGNAFGLICLSVCVVRALT